LATAGFPARIGVSTGTDTEEHTGFLPWVLDDGTVAGCEVGPLHLRASGDASRLARSYRVFFTSSIGRSDDDLCVQWFAAATLALVTEGTLCDPQEGMEYEGEAAIREARRQCHRE
jgi:hypothetical protein